jgi:UDP-GlcNAc:undecaprenyl-phosphate GlcNAc-1-phosphate transferase
MDLTLLSLFFATFVSTLVFVPITRAFGAGAGLLDHPHERRIQRTAVPRTGGIGILIGMLCGVIALIQLSDSLGVPVGRPVIAIFFGAGLIHLTGILDDLVDLPPFSKLFAQMLAVGVVVGHGLVIDRVVLPGGATLELGALALPLTSFFILGYVNAINLVDGLDGLAGGIVAIGAALLGLNGIMTGNAVLAALSTVLLATVSGFLPYNFSGRRKTFLGDAGSMLLGFMVPVTAIHGSRFSGESTGLFLALAVATVPILDTATTILRRFRNRKAIFRPDTMHVHHRLIRFGLSPARSVGTILALTLFFGGLTFHVQVEGATPVALASALAGVVAVAEIRRQKRRNAAEDETSFKEILLYLLGALNGRGPRLDGGLTMLDVLAVSPAAASSAGGNGGNGSNGKKNGKPRIVPVVFGNGHSPPDVGPSEPATVPATIRPAIAPAEPATNAPAIPSAEPVTAGRRAW